jgi:hypothetical protein
MVLQIVESRLQSGVLCLSQGSDGSDLSLLQWTFSVVLYSTSLPSSRQNRTRLAAVVGP